MNIAKTTPSAYNPQFNGIHIATSTNCIKGVQTKIDLYELTKTDSKFLNQLSNSVNLKNLYPNSRITNQEYNRWQEMLTLATDKASQPKKSGYIATINDKPCGIIAFEKGNNKFNIDCICTWPVEVGKKVTLAGQTLFKQVFSDFLESKANSINLVAILDGPFSTVSKYMHLGFKQVGGENFLVAMKTNKARTIDTMKNLDFLIDTKKTNSTEDVNLLNKLSI